jgi:hypothetical protein
MSDGNVSAIVWVDGTEEHCSLLKQEEDKSIKVWCRNYSQREWKDRLAKSQSVRGESWKKEAKEMKK